MTRRVVRDDQADDDREVNWLDLPVERWPSDPTSYPDADHWPRWTDQRVEIDASGDADDCHPTEVPDGI